MLAAAEYGAGRIAEPRPPVEDGEAYNISHAEARKAQSWAAAKADFDASMERAAALVSALEDDQLGNATLLPWGAEATVGEAIGDALGHVGEHVVDLENNS